MPPAGWVKLTVPLLPMLKVFQLTMAAAELWLMPRVLRPLTRAGLAMLTLPAATKPPVGRVLAAVCAQVRAPCKPSARVNADFAQRTARLAPVLGALLHTLPERPDLPLEVAISGTAIHVWLDSLKTRR